MARALGAERAMASLAINSAELEFGAGDAPAAAALVSEVLPALRSRSDARRATALANLSAYLLTLERYDEADSLALDALTLGRDLQAGVAAAFALQHLAAVALLRPVEDGNAARDASTRAARLLGYVNAQLTALEAFREYTEQQEYDKMMTALRGAFGDAVLANLMAEGGAWSEDQAVAEAMLI